MRQIKFRAWEKGGSKMFLVLGLNIGGSIYVSDHPDAPDRRIESLDCELMQFTGLIDKNGKEIYEGDILNWGDNFHSKVYFDLEEAAFKIEELGIVEGRFETEPRTHDMHAYTSKPVVLGNIYQNPELLTK